MFESLSAKFQGAFASLRSKGRLKASDIDEITAEIRSALLDSDVAVSVVDFFIEQLKISKHPWPIIAKTVFFCKNNVKTHLEVANS